MKNTYLSLNNTSSSKLLDILNKVPKEDRDSSWRNLHDEVSKIVDVWSNIDIRSMHLSKIHAKAKRFLKR